MMLKLINKTTMRTIFFVGKEKIFEQIVKKSVSFSVKNFQGYFCAIKKIIGYVEKKQIIRNGS